MGSESRGAWAQPSNFPVRSVERGLRLQGQGGGRIGEELIRGHSEAAGQARHDGDQHRMGTACGSDRQVVTRGAREDQELLWLLKIIGRWTSAEHLLCARH